VGLLLKMEDGGTMQEKIYTLNIGGTNCYLIQGERFFLIDSGEPGSLPVFLSG
jgi:flavorubredoxin